MSTSFALDRFFIMIVLMAMMIILILVFIFLVIWGFALRRFVVSSLGRRCMATSVTASELWFTSAAAIIAGQSTEAFVSLNTVMGRRSTHHQP
jgi:heme/copper-type cytochrome/quinol oxidase subunit 2